MKKKIFVAFIIIALIAGAIVISMGLYSTRPIPPANTPEELTINVKNNIVKNGEYDINVATPARVMAKNIVNLGVQAGGMILNGDVPLKAGQHFRKGDLLVNIYSKDIEANIVSQKSQFLTTIAKTLPDIKIDFPDSYSKWAAFFDNLSLDNDMPELPEITNSKEKVYLSTKGVISAYYALKQAEIVLDKYKLYAPFNGVIKSINKEIGSIATNGGEIGTITSTDNLELRIGVSQTEAQLMSVGNKVNISSYENDKYVGTIVRISPMVDSKTQRVAVYVSLNEPSMNIMDGQMVETSMKLNPLKNVYKVPREIINKYDQLYKIENDRIYPIDVDVVMSVDKYSYIQGIEDGTSVVYESLVEPKVGTKVNIIETIDAK